MNYDFFVKDTFSSNKSTIKFMQDKEIYVKKWYVLLDEVTARSLQSTNTTAKKQGGNMEPRW